MAEGVPLSTLLPARLDSMESRVKSRLCEDEQVGGMKLAWGFIGSELQKALRLVLDCDLLELLANGWAEADALTDLADPEKNPPGERTLVELGAHDWTRELHPVIAITLGSCPCVELKFTFVVTAKVSGVRLSIVNGHIVGGDLGEAWATGQLSYEGTPLHDAAESSKISVPGGFNFGSPGVRIPLLPPGPA